MSNANSSRPAAPRTKTLSPLQWFASGLIIGIWLTTMWLIGETAWEMDKWKCQRYSPLDGNCSLYLRRGQP